MAAQQIYLYYFVVQFGFILLYTYVQRSTEAGKTISMNKQKSNCFYLYFVFVEICCHKSSWAGLGAQKQGCVTH